MNDEHRDLPHPEKGPTILVTGGAGVIGTELLPSHRVPASAQRDLRAGRPRLTNDPDQGIETDGFQKPRHVSRI